MPLHLIKLCVGCDTVANLEDWIKQKLQEKKKRRQKPEHIHTTRMVPKRADELTSGGSLYWVIRGQITCRERILDIRPFTDKDGIGRARARFDQHAFAVEHHAAAADAVFVGKRADVEDALAAGDLAADHPIKRAAIGQFLGTLGHHAG